MNNHTDKPVSIDAFGDSRQGGRRATNDDQFLIAQLNRSLRIDSASKSDLENIRKFGDDQGCLLLVADGVSGAPEAQRASGVAVDAVIDHALNGIGWNPNLDLDAEVRLRKQLKATIADCDRRVTKMAKESERPESQSDSIASTVTMALVRWPHVFIAHAGDSRAYLIRKDGKEVQQLTTDHTLAERMVQKGELARDEAASSPFRRMLWNAAGGKDGVTPELHTETIRPGDTLLLCTDGVARNVTERTLRQVVAESDTAERAGRAILDLVRTIDDADNMTVALAHFRDETGNPSTLRMPRSLDGGAWRSDHPRSDQPAPGAAAVAP